MGRGGRSTVGQRGRGGEQKRAHSFSPDIEQQHLQGIFSSLPEQSQKRGKKRCGKKRCGKKRCRSRNWSPTETIALIESVLEEGRFCKRKIKNWEAASKKIKKCCGSTRTEKECQRRFDTLTKARKGVKTLTKARCGVDYKQFFQKMGKERSEQLSTGLPTHLTLEYFEVLEQIEQQKEPVLLSSSISGGAPFPSGTQTRSRNDLAKEVGSSGTGLISSLESSPFPVSTHGSESTDLPFQQRAQDPATPNRTGVPQVVHPNLPDGEDSGAVCLDHTLCDFESIDKDLQESEDNLYFCNYYGLVC